MKDVEIWLPHNEITELVALRTDAPVEPVPDRGRRVWLHHGSSISHGSDAASPTTTWPALAASLGGVDLINLGLGGSALLDPFTARAMRDTPADLISVKIGINLVNTDLMRLRAFTPAVHGFLDTIREGHPTTPLLVVSPILCPHPRGHPRPQRPGLQQPRRGQAPVPGRGRPRGARRREADAQRHPGRAGPHREAARGRATPTCTTSTAATSTARRTSPNCRCPTSSTRTPPPTAASANASPPWRSARADRSAPSGSDRSAARCTLARSDEQAAVVLVPRFDTGESRAGTGTQRCAAELNAALRSIALCITGGSCRAAEGPL